MRRHLHFPCLLLAWLCATSLCAQQLETKDGLSLSLDPQGRIASVTTNGKAW